MEFNINNFIKTLAILVSLTITNICNAVTLEAIDKKQIEADVLDTFNALVKSAETFDTPKYLAFFDKDKFTGLSQDGTVWHSFKDFELLISSGFPMMDRTISLEFTKVKVTVINATTAVLVNQYQHSMLLKSGDKVQQAGGGTQVWSKSNDAWKLVSVSASAASH